MDINGEEKIFVKLLMVVLVMMLTILGCSITPSSIFQIDLSQNGSKKREISGEPDEFGELEEENQKKAKSDSTEEKYSIGITHYAHSPDFLGVDQFDEIPAGWKSYLVGIWIKSNNSDMEAINIDADGQIDVTQLSPLDNSAGDIAYVETEEGVKYPVDFVEYAITLSGFHLNSISTIEINETIPAGVPFSGVWGDNVEDQTYNFLEWEDNIELQPIQAIFLVPEEFHPVRLVFPKINASLDLADSASYYPNLSKPTELEPLPGTMSMNEFISISFSQIKMRLSSESAILEIPIEIKNSDQTSQREIPFFKISLIDSKGFFWDQDIDWYFWDGGKHWGDCSGFPNSVGPGLTENSSICFSSPYPNNFINYPEHFILSIYSEAKDQARAFLNPFGGVEIENCDQVGKDEIFESDISKSDLHVVYDFYDSSGEPEDRGLLDVPDKVTITKSDNIGHYWGLELEADQAAMITLTNDNNLEMSLSVYGPDGNRYPTHQSTNEKGKNVQLINQALCDGIYHIFVDYSGIYPREGFSFTIKTQK